jgi:hypothetical protein
MPNETVLTEKERTLIAVGASIAAGGLPCTAYSIKAAQAAGACNISVSLTVEAATAEQRTTNRQMEMAEK